MHRNASLPQLKTGVSGASLPAAPAPCPAASADVCAAEMLRRNPYEGTLLVCDFDRTLVDFDAGERLCDELAPELTSLLSSLQMPANFVPVTNTVLSEMQRRGVSRDRLVSCLREMGREVPLAVQRMLQWSARRGMETVVLSDCNSVFISHILTGARLNTLVRHVITNQASFQRVAPPPPASAAADDGDGGGGAVVEPAVPAAAARPPRVPSGFGSGWLFRSSSGSGLSSSTSAGAGKPPAAPAVAHRLVIEPRHDHRACGSHGCSLCPANLCKGAELAALRASAPRARRVVYCGDGANDLCPCLGLGPQDVVLARAGHDLERLIAQRAAAAAADPGVRRVAAAVHVWHSHDELYRLVQQHAT
ncbi:hypothetical protein CHLNCDRAFT_137320 [Chlorella variabilis]|uniref:Uncharacterized protein n=1 Tax=Chlorella variabilis TaxID=554065 RepID=E1ZM61_CHLVA|nr:hypothetical protein CHLNCDRAFT_137320 [Chlorella variabilis]EFN52947.1 hypothetical protein CHLNCDRAFT_137320 [Chlorella variabilis]|eukprot:XP_005845049.1 hypothetical protein CHLNCDRAFT_137320 [Chlorella variabilis]